MLKDQHFQKVSDTAVVMFGRFPESFLYDGVDPYRKFLRLTRHD